MITPGLRDVQVKLIALCIITLELNYGQVKLIASAMITPGLRDVQVKLNSFMHHHT